MRLADTRPPFAGLANLSWEALASLPTPCYLLDEGSCAATANFCWGCSSAPAAKFCWRRRLFPTLMFTRCWLLIWRAPSQRPVREPPWQRRAAGKREPCVLRGLPGRRVRGAAAVRRPHRVQFAHQLAKFGPAAKAAGKSVGLRLNPECSTQEGHAIYDPCAPAAALAHPRPVGCRRAGRPGPARITGRTALPHPVRAGCRCTGPDAGGGGKQSSGVFCPG